MTAPISITDLERVMSLGWRGTSTQQLGDWLLRAGSGFTGRANSVLPLGSPGCSIDDALERVGEFYRRHQLRPLFQIPIGPETAALDGDLEQRGWADFNLSWVLIADVDDALAHCPPRPDQPPARFDDDPSADWLAGYLYRGTPLPDSAVDVLCNADDVTFASLRDDAGRAAVVRGAVADGWLGVTALTVAKDRRRTGVGRHLMGELLRWGISHRAQRVYLQVAADNTAALGLYARLGFTPAPPVPVPPSTGQLTNLPGPTTSKDTAMTPPLPYAELHLHLEGTLEPELIYRLSERNGIALPYQDIDDLRSRYTFTDLQSFLDLYYTNMQVLQTEQDFADLTGAYLSRARQAGIRHAEVFLDLQAHTGRGIHPTTVLTGVQQALSTSEQQHDISSGLIVTMLRHLSPASAMTAYQQAIDSGVPLLGIGLCSSEIGNPATPFADVFARARADGLHTVAHAGEEGDPSYIWEVLTLNVERVDHGIRAIDDPRLLHHLADQQIPLTVCPLSNVRLRAVDRMTDHPLATMLRQGLRVSVHSDDPAYFGGYLDDNVDAVRAALTLTDGEITQLATNSITSSFASPSRKDLLLGMLG